MNPVYVSDPISVVGHDLSKVCSLTATESHFMDMKVIMNIHDALYVEYTSLCGLPSLECGSGSIYRSHDGPSKGIVTCEICKSLHHLTTLAELAI